VLITDTPSVDQLIDLDPAAQLAFLDDAALLARAVSAVCRRRDPQFRRINIEVQGNTGRVSDHHQLGPQHDDLRAELTVAIDAELAVRGGSSR